MRKSKIFVVFILGILGLSCSSGDESSLQEDEKKVILSFGPVLQDYVNDSANKQQVVCAAVPAFAELVVSQDGVMVAGTMDEPVRIKILQDEQGKFFTTESASLMLDPGICTLEYFSILDADENRVWIAPIQSDEPGHVSNLVATPLPMDIPLSANGKKYADVPVVCYDDRIVNENGYLFININSTEAIEFCIFGNYCDENGRHAEAIQYQVSAWTYSGDPGSPHGNQLYDMEYSPLLISDNIDGTASYSAEPLCLTLPDTDGEDQYYIEIYYGDLIRSGIITDNQVKDLFVGPHRMEYFHFREGNCNLEDEPDLF